MPERALIVLKVVVIGSNEAENGQIWIKKTRGSMTHQWLDNNSIIAKQMAYG